MIWRRLVLRPNHFGECHEPASSTSARIPHSMEQGQARRTEGSLKVERNLGHPDPPQLAKRTRDLALFDLAIDSKLRACDLVKLRVSDVASSGRIASRAIVMQQKTKQSVRFEITESTREAVAAWIEKAELGPKDFLFPSRLHGSPHLSTRQYARVVECWICQLGLDPAAYGTHTMRRTKASLIYRRTHNLRAIQLLLGHTKLESTVRYLGIEVDDALEMAEETEA